MEGEKNKLRETATPDLVVYRERLLVRGYDAKNVEEQKVIDGKVKKINEELDRRTNELFEEK